MQTMQPPGRALQPDLGSFAQDIYPSPQKERHQELLIDSHHSRSAGGYRCEEPGIAAEFLSGAGSVPSLTVLPGCSSQMQGPSVKMEAPLTEPEGSLSEKWQRAQSQARAQDALLRGSRSL
ncbi:uncharacterized protein LOC143834127 [Paroedura picta]|uniref:uncharacterized protein LOC143834127 n=1 Tax=Paroedura picta TaxID=143630 RepID=UPI0040566A04